MSKPLFLFVLYFFTVIKLASPTLTAPVVDLGYAQYQGSFNASSNITQFLGIRFAAAPTGGHNILVPNICIFILPYYF